MCWAGAALSLLLVFNLLPRLSLLLLYVLYLSLLYAGQTFMTYQWDTFLLEAGFLALLMSFATTPGVWLLRWLLFRFMFMSGVVKLLSGDPNWWNLSALSYHFLTQPLPTPLAWYAAQLPAAALLKFATGSMFVDRAGSAVPDLLPASPALPGGLRHPAAASCILVTGNYNWFNLQTMLLCLPLFDDAALRRSVAAGALLAHLPLWHTPRPRRATSRSSPSAPRSSCSCSLVQMDERFGGSPPAVTQLLERGLEPLHIVSPYGLFAVMTTERDEIVIEGSYDGVEWREYEFRYKPGDVARRPPWNIPHQPRLDWQMWFAALDDPRRLRWFALFLARVLNNEPTVLALMDRNPFPDKPPRYVRAKFYDYTYAGAADKTRGPWWNRRLLGLYFPAVSLKE